MEGATPPPGRVTAQATAPLIFVAVGCTQEGSAHESLPALVCTGDVVAASAVVLGERPWPGRERWGEGLVCSMLREEPGGGGLEIPTHLFPRWQRRGQAGAPHEKSLAPALMEFPHALHLFTAAAGAG